MNFIYKGDYMDTLKVFSPKQVDEQYFLGFNFTDDIGSETIQSATVTAICNGVDVTSDLITTLDQIIVNPYVYFWIKGGVKGETYKIDCQVVCSEDSVYEVTGYIKVKD